MALPLLETESGSERDDLRDMVRGLVAKDRADWTQLVELGLVGIAVPEFHGGGGAGVLEQAVVCEELARTLVPSAYFATVCLAAEALLAADDPGQGARLLASLVSGERTATLSFQHGRVESIHGQWSVSADLRRVPDGAQAELVLLVARTQHGPTLFAVTGGEKLHREPLQTLDPSRPLARLRIDGAPAQPIGQFGTGAAVLDRVCLRATALLAAEQAVIARHCVDEIGRYFLERRQFGRQIGAFQALKHRIADAAVQSELATSSAWYALQLLADGADDDEVRFAAAVAAAKCGDAALNNAAEMIQLHGGIGYTWEHHAHRYLRRAKADQYLLDTPAAQRDWLGTTVANGAGPATSQPQPTPASPILVELREWLAANGADEVAADRQPIPSGEKYSPARRDWFHRLGEAGWATPNWPVGEGGQGLDRDDSGAVIEELRQRGLDRPERDFVGVWLAGPTILQWGNEVQRADHMPPLALGERRWCQLFSEPGAGSDLASLRTSAVPIDGERWLVNGQKIWSSFADTADYGLLLARTDPSVPKHAGITYFLLDMRTPGVEVRPLRQMTGDAEFNEVFLTDVVVPDSARLGPLNEGWKVVISTLAQERNSLTGPPVVGPGRADTVIAEAVDAGAWACADVRNRLQHLLVDERALQTATLRASVQSNRDPGAIDSIRKLVSADLHERTGRVRIDIDPENTLGWAVDEPMPPGTRSFLEMKKYCIAGGTSEIQRNIIAERVLGMPRDIDPDRGQPFNNRNRSEGLQP
ncbi:acyl-CoA dehydrogenase [Mycolicibacterium sp. Dal123E01]|uniref:acyl-CoA dehydrogenase n=1 Tax=Mycolicibacterium sp. Dal123E01 TaxID=3457578 RepID=UPI00403ED222